MLSNLCLLFKDNNEPHQLSFNPLKWQFIVLCNKQNDLINYLIELITLIKKASIYKPSIIPIQINFIILLLWLPLTKHE